MGVLIQIKDVPEDVHRTLKTRAAASGQSLTEYVRGMLIRAASRPSPAELDERIHSREPVELTESGAEIIRKLRDALE